MTRVRPPAGPAWSDQRTGHSGGALTRARQSRGGRGHDPNVLSTLRVALWGARRPDQLNGIADVFGWKLTAQDLADIDALLAEHIADPVGPEFMAPPLRKKAA